MKKITLVSGILLVILNTVVGFIFSDYQAHNMLFADSSIALTTLVLFSSCQISIPDGFKIGFTLLFIISGVFRFICSIVSPDQLADNIPLLVFICFVAIEWILLFVGHAMRDK